MHTRSLVGMMLGVVLLAAACGDDSVTTTVAAPGTTTATTAPVPSTTDGAPPTTVAAIDPELDAIVGDLCDKLAISTYWQAEPIVVEAKVDVGRIAKAPILPDLMTERCPAAWATWAWEDEALTQSRVLWEAIDPVAKIRPTLAATDVYWSRCGPGLEIVIENTQDDPIAVKAAASMEDAPETGSWGIIALEVGPGNTRNIDTGDDPPLPTDGDRVCSLSSSAVRLIDPPQGAPQRPGPDTSGDDFEQIVGTLLEISATAQTLDDITAYTDVRSSDYYRLVNSFRYHPEYWGEQARTGFERSNFRVMERPRDDLVVVAWDQAAGTIASPQSDETIDIRPSQNMALLMRGPDDRWRFGVTTHAWATSTVSELLLDGIVANGADH